MGFVQLAPTFVVCLGLIGSPGQAQEAAKAKPAADAMIEAYLSRQAMRISQNVLDGAKTREQWLERVPRLRQEYLDMLGLWPLPKKTPLRETHTGIVNRSKENVTIEKIHFQSMPGLYVTGNLYRPSRTSGKLPAVLYLCGHSGRGRDGNKTAFQDHGMWFATHGYVCLVIDTLQLGEIPGIHHGTYREGRWWWQARGYTSAGVECWNGIRAIDYLISRPDVDPARIAATGISGGGAATFWIAAADERVMCAVPVSGMSDLESYVANKVINGHCDCMFLVNTYQWEWTTIASLIAPRPMLFANSDNDPIFPMDGNRRVIARLRQHYQLLGQPDLIGEHISTGGHAYRPDLRIAIFQWINKHVKGDTSPVSDANYELLPGKELRVFPEDKDLPGDAINGKIDESFVPDAAPGLPAPGRFEEWKAGLMTKLRAKSFRGFPQTIPPAKIMAEGDRPFGDFVTEPDIKTWTIAIRGGARAPVLVVLNPGEWRRDDPNGLKKLEWASGLTPVGQRSEFLLPRGVVEEWNRKSPPNYVDRAHALLGKTVDQGRVWDICAMARRLTSEPGSARPGRAKLIGKGQAGILALYAALLEPSIEEVVILDPPTSHREGPIFLNVLRVLDIPEAMGLLAPRKLTLVGAKDKAFDRTAEIYRLAGAADKLQRE